jgi:hypothetical protein
VPALELAQCFFGSAPFAASVFGASDWAQILDQYDEKNDMA